MQWLLFALSAVGAAAAAATETPENHAANVQIDWIRSHGGFVSPKIELQHANKTNPEAGLGVFVTEDVSEKETLMIIPRSCLLTSEGSFETCDTARNLLKQRQLKDESKYAPYVDYVFEHKSHLPAQWSDAGKQLLQTIVGKELPPFDWTGLTFKDACNGSGDALEEEAFFITISRGWDDLLVPVMDMLNHRNGHWYNVDSNSIHEDEDDVTVFALRDVHAGEQLYLSYNECKDCHDIEFTYVLPEILRDFGVIEEYPRRWHFEEHALAFELDQVPGQKELELEWFSDEPDENGIKFLKGHLARLQNLGEYVSEQAEKVASSYERNVSIEYYNALMTAMEYALWFSHAGDNKEGVSQEFDELDTVAMEMEFNHFVCDYGHARRDTEEDHYEPIDGTHSTYQDLMFAYSHTLNDTCMYMNDLLHTCTSFRPHYHEVFVHYPARYLDEVKRVAFIGGGDNMIVHEILKYPSLEFVVGLELDQNVVRSSFKNFGTQPHFDDNRLHWYFGDAAKSLLTLPTDYYGTFDLVLIDLLEEVVDVLKVTDDIDINEAAKLLLKPDGVVARNEDWNFASDDPFTDFTVDLYYVDVPISCYIGITMGSNSVDFLTAIPKDHHIDTVYLKSVDEMEDQFDLWYNYRKSSNRTNTPCKEAGMTDPALDEGLTNNFALFMAIDAEDASAPLQTSSEIQDAFSKALKNVGLTETSTQLSLRDDGYEVVFILQEGYVIARTWPEEKYCAFDLLLWSSTAKLEDAKGELVASVGSKSVSSYRVVASGMSGATQRDKDANKIGPPINKPCIGPGTNDPIQHAPTNQNVINTVLAESASFITGSRVLVICGDASSPCHSLDVLNEKGMEVIPVWTWPSLARDEDASRVMMLSCEQDTLASLQEMDGKLSGIVIDPKVPRVMGQILHKIFSDKQVRRDLLADDHVVLALSVDPSEASWRRALLDRFRTDFSRFDPSYRAEVLFNDSDLELGVFYASTHVVYSDLLKVVDRIEKESGLTADIRHIMNGMNPFVADFEPSKAASHADYDHSSAFQQWSSQHALEEQTLFQFTTSEEEEIELTPTTIYDALHEGILKMNEGDDSIDFKVYDDVGDGTVIVAFWSLGHAVLTWDGRNHVSVNIVSDQDHYQCPKILSEQLSLVITSRDEMPRGIGRVVNFLPQVEAYSPRWAV